jgi:predicted nuclease of predicted toxin-antitoxin system
MKIKLDENLPGELAEALASLKHDVHTVPQEGLVGEDDATIFGSAAREGRVLFTQDLDFSDLRKFKPGTHPGIVLIRLREPSRRRLTQRVRQVVESVDIDLWSRCFVVISDRKLRVRSP